MRKNRLVQEGVEAFSTRRGLPVRAFRVYRLGWGVLVTVYTLCEMQAGAILGDI